MDRTEINKHARMLGTAVRALTGFYAGLIEGSPGERKAAATLFRKAENERNRVTLGGIATIANNVLQAIPALESKGDAAQREGTKGDIKDRTTDGFYVYASGCESTRVAEGAKSKAMRFLELYKAFKNVEVTGDAPADLTLPKVIADEKAATATLV